MYYTFIITYSAFNAAGKLIASGKMRVKNRMSPFHAKASFEEYLKKKHANFHRLVIHTCNVETILGEMQDKIFDLFNNFKP